MLICALCWPSPYRGRSRLSGHLCVGTTEDVWICHCRVRESWSMLLLLWCWAKRKEMGAQLRKFNPPIISQTSWFANASASSVCILFFLFWGLPDHCKWCKFVPLTVLWATVAPLCWIWEWSDSTTFAAVLYLCFSQGQAALSLLSRREGYQRSQPQGRWMTPGPMQMISEMWNRKCTSLGFMPAHWQRRSGLQKNQNTRQTSLLWRRADST